MPPSATSKRPARVDDAPGEGAAHVPEEGRLEQRLGHAGAVLADEGALRAAAVGVDGAGDELLAGAALADDEHRDVAAVTRSTRRSSSRIGSLRPAISS